MTNELTTLTVGQSSGATWRVLYDGRMLGDDKGYSSQAAALAELDNRLAIDARDAIRFERPLLYVKG